MIWVAIIIGVALYGAIAVVSFGASTCGGAYIMRSDWGWAAIWPLFWLRPLGWRVRVWWRKHGIVRRWSHGWQALGVPLQRADWWLLKVGEEMSLMWANRNEPRSDS